MRKKCAKCLKTFDTSKFYKNSRAKDGLSSYCATCVKLTMKLWIKNNPEKRSAHSRTDYERHKEARNKKRRQRERANREHTREMSKVYQRRYRLRKRGLKEDSLCEKLQQQGSVCALCDREITARSAVVDHCHESGKTRDLLCAMCNISLGHMERKDFFVDRAIAYIERHRRLG
jgi:hypothetical protein